jgi:hypothetical protein
MLVALKRWQSQACRRRAPSDYIAFGSREGMAKNDAPLVTEKQLARIWLELPEFLHSNNRAKEVRKAGEAPVL